MAAPNIDVIVYPQGPSTTERQLQYLELAPKDTSSQPTCVLPLQIWIRNKENASIHLTSIEANFSDPSLNKTITLSPPLGVAAGSSGQFYATNAQYIVLPSPPPTPFTLKLHFTGFSVWSHSVHFAAFPNSYQFPGKFSDLGKSRFWRGRGAAHAGGGDQIFHYDLTMMNWDAGLNQWSRRLPGKDGTKNEHYVIWGTPVYAIADGVVSFYSNSIDANPNPPDTAPWGKATGYGNAFNIKHGPYIGTYMHMQKGSLNPALITGYPENIEFDNGPEVKAGDFLGLVGNAGTSSEPHLHVGLVIRDAQKTHFSIPLPFGGAVWAVDNTELSPNDVRDAPWVNLAKQGLPWITDSGDDAVSLTAYFKTGQFAQIDAAIDPLAVLLGSTSAAYVNLTLPDPPPLDVIVMQVREQVRAMSPAARARATERVRALQGYLQALQAELARTRG
jgi:hypothetical protein